MKPINDHGKKFVLVVLLALFGALMFAACSISLPKNETNPEQATKYIQQLTSTASQNPQGSGNFPHMFVVAPIVDGKHLALYLVEGSIARQLLVYEDLNTDASITCQPSADGKYAACLIRDSKGVASVEVVDGKDPQRTLIGTGIGSLSPNEKGGPSEEITSFAWLDQEHLLYSKITFPREFSRADRNWNIPLPPLKGEVWLSNLDGKDQRLLVTAPIYRLLGASPDVQTLYVTRLLPGREDWLMQGFSLLDIATGKLENLWPSEEKSTTSLYSFKMITLPDGAPRITFIGAGPPGTTSSVKPPVVWIGDPETREAKPVWKMDHGEEYTVNGKTHKQYYFSGDILGSPDSASEFVYSMLGNAWKVNIEDGEEEKLGPVYGKLLVWAQEGIVSQSRNVIHLLGTTGEELGEIPFRILLP